MHTMVLYGECMSGRPSCSDGSTATRLMVRRRACIVAGLWTRPRRRVPRVYCSRRINKPAKIQRKPFVRTAD